MAYDPEQHDFDPVTGFIIHKDTGEIVGLHGKATPSPEGVEYPKWVKPHDSHVVRKAVDGAPDHLSTPGWEQHHRHRLTEEVMVLVEDAEEEARALAAFVAPTEPAPPKPKLVKKT